MSSVSVSGRLRQLDQQATPGPWRRGTGEVHNGVEDFPDGYFITVAEPRAVDKPYGPLPDVVMRWGEFERDADAALLIALRNALPLLADLAEAAEQHWRQVIPNGNDRFQMDAHDRLRDALAALADQLATP